MGGLIMANQFLYGLILQQVLLEDSLQTDLIDMVIADAFRVNHDDWTIFTDSQTVGDSAFCMVIMLRVIEPVLFDQIGQALF